MHGVTSVHERPESSFCAASCEVETDRGRGPTCTPAATIHTDLGGVLAHADTPTASPPPHPGVEGTDPFHLTPGNLWVAHLGGLIEICECKLKKDGAFATFELL